MFLTRALISEAVIGLLPGFAADIGGTCILGPDGPDSGPFPLSWPPVGAFAHDVFTRDCSRAVLFLFILFIYFILFY